MENDIISNVERVASGQEQLPVIPKCADDNARHQAGVSLSVDFREHDSGRDSASSRRDSLSDGVNLAKHAPCLFPRDVDEIVVRSIPVQAARENQRVAR